jgi:hypothetical protein
MLTRVAVGQVRFNLPGLAADPRGVAAGRELLLRFVTLERLVAFLRLLSAERCPDEVWSGLRLYAARPHEGTREVLVRLPTPAGQVADLVASTTRLAGGTCFTGAGRHFVPWRDARAPLGYDAAVVAHDDGDLTIYTDGASAPWRQESELSLERLLLRLELRRRPGGVEAAFRALGGGPVGGEAEGGSATSSAGAEEASGPAVHLSVRRGLGPRLAELLFGAGVEGEVAICEPARQSAFSAPPIFWLFRIPALPPRLLGLCSRTPGVGMYLPVTEDILVAAGHEHPVHLASCRPALRGDRLLLLPAPPRPVIEVSPRPSFVGLGDLVKVKVPATEEARLAASARGKADGIEVPLRLEPVTSAGPAKAALVPWSQAVWLRRLLFALPPVAVRTYEVALLRPGVLVVAPERLEGLPFGQPLEEAAPGVLVPVGTRLRPALSPALLAERLGLSDGALCVFPDLTSSPFRVARRNFEQLERRAFAAPELPWAPPARAADRAAADGVAEPAPEIHNEPLGLFPLWGLKP